MQLFVSDCSFISIYPMKAKQDYLKAMKLFAKEVGVPEVLVADHSGEQTSNKSREYCQLIGTTLRVLEEGTLWANRAELYIGLLKEAIRKDL